MFCISSGEGARLVTVRSSDTVAGEDDSVGLHVFANFPGEAHVLHFFWRRRSLGDGAQLGFGDFAEVWLLNEHASGDALELKLAVRFEAAGRQFEEAKIFLGGENGFCFFVESRGGDAFREKLGDFFGGGGIDRAIEGQHAAKGRYGIAGERFQVRVAKSFLFGGAAGIVVLDDDSGGAAKLGDQAARGFEIDEIIVGEFFALELVGSS